MDLRLIPLLSVAVLIIAAVLYEDGHYDMYKSMFLLLFVCQDNHSYSGDQAYLMADCPAVNSRALYCSFICCNDGSASYVRAMSIES